ncbi:MAG: hypothetical protein AB8I08_02200 [Sandaracinaceae bacterium]
MTSLFQRCLLVLLSLGVSAPALAQDGTVRLPLAQYQALMQGGAANSASPTVRLAYSNATANVTVSEGDHGQASARVQMSATVRVLSGEGRTLVILPTGGAAIASATVDGSAADLIAVAGGSAWPAEGAGTHRVTWTYEVDARRYGDGRVVGVPTVPATTALTATVPGTNRGVSVVPGSAVSTSDSGAQTTIVATVPPGAGLSLAWRAADAAGYTLSRASYTGELRENIVRFEATLTVELAGQGPVIVPLFPSEVALEDVRIDRQEASITVTDTHFAVPVRGQGRHTLTAAFEVPVANDDGLPHVNLLISPTPVSRFELTLPGEREVTVEPWAGVRAARQSGATIARFHVPMTERVSISWAEAVPEGTAEAEVEVRAHADLVHVVRPDEGVLGVRAFGTWHITRGTLSRLEIALPDAVQINALEISEGVVSDWRVTGDGDERLLTVFLDRSVEGDVTLDVRYEQPWPMSTQTTVPFAVPMLRARGVHRQRGMVALLSNHEITLAPREQEHVTQVGDNLLPAEVRNEISSTVAHTFRYLDEIPSLSAIGTERETEDARFDVQVDTLVSLGEVSTTVVASIEVDVKSGGLDRLTIQLPEGLNVLEVSAPSLRQHQVEGDGDARRLVLELTQPMEGHFPVQVRCERITGQEEELDIPLLSVDAAEVERGRLAVEALAAFQVDEADSTGLSAISPSELPQALVQQTNNPILHAYRYAQADPTPRFAVRITRHEVIQTPIASVDEATYRTLITRDGVAVTTAHFMVRNRRQQFLRLTLPEGGQVWSASVNGQPQTPARDSGSEDGAPTVLINIVSANQAFPVDVVYRTTHAPIGSFGRISAQLPQLDVVVTHSRWEVYLPEGPTYSDVDTSMTLVSRGSSAGSQFAGMVNQTGMGVQLEVPSEGVLFVFRKMYAGNSDDVVSFSIPYASGAAGPAISATSAFGALLLCLGLLAFAVIRLGFPVPSPLAERVPLSSYRDHREGERPPEARRAAKRMTVSVLATSVFGLVLLAVTVGYLSASAIPATLVAVLVFLGAMGLLLKRRVDQWRAARPAAPAAPPAPTEVPSPSPAEMSEFVWPEAPSGQGDVSAETDGALEEHGPNDEEE